MLDNLSADVFETRKANTAAFGALLPQPINWKALVLAFFLLNATDKNHLQKAPRKETLSFRLPFASQKHLSSLFKEERGGMGEKINK